MAARTGRHRERRARTLRIATAILAAALVLSLPAAYAVFTATNGNRSNALSATTPFPTYPVAVNASSPLFYHRLEEQAGMTTAADSSGNGLTGVYGTAFQPATLLLPFDEAAGTTARDLAGQATANNATLTNATWAAGHAGTAVSFNGTSTYVETQSSGVTTSGYFTVSAWVYLSSKAADMTAVSQVDTGNSAFRLGYLTAPVDRFVFSMTQTNTAGATIDQSVDITGSPSLNTWYHIVGSYEGTGGGRIYIYVNNVETGNGSGPTVAHTTTWNATGPVEIGASKVNNARGEWWNGRIDEVRLHAPAVTASPVRELFNTQDGGPSTNWTMDDALASTTVTDFSGSTNTGTLGSGASLTTTPAGRTVNVVTLDGSANGYVNGRIAGVDTTKSFTAATWVYLTDNTSDHTALSQGAGTGSAFELKFESGGGGRWEFAMSQAESMTPGYDTAFPTTHPVALNTWVHLVGVFDATAGQLALYVGGAADGTTVHNTLWDGGTTGLQVGRQRELGGWINPWPGSIEEARTWRRALSAAEVARLFAGAASTSTQPFGADSLNSPGALQGAQQGQQATTAESFSGLQRANGFNPTRYANPTTFSLECWFRTVGTGGRLINFSTTANFDSTGSFDRMLWVNASGNVIFGGASGTTNLAQSPSTYFDGAWHHVVVTVGPASQIVLYLDGTSVATQATYSLGNYTGVWRWGGDKNSGTWPGPTYFTGLIDEVAVYGTELTAQQVAWHYHANH